MLHLGTRRSFLMSVIALLVLGVASAQGQSTLATLTGTVVDGSAAVIPGASVVATNLATGLQRQAATDPAGGFLVPNLDPGRYVVTVSIQGFQDNVLEVELLARQVVRVDVRLQIAGTAERVEVRGTQPVIETDRSTIGHSQSGEDIDRLALNFRATDSTSPIVVATLAQGVQQDRTGAISIAGALPFMTSFSVDGISSQRIRFGGPSRELFPSVESIEEFKVTTAGNNPEFMQETDLTTVTKSGSNQLHGTGFWFFQDSAMTASTRFTPTDAAGRPVKPEVRTNSFGGSAGGPVHTKPRVFLRDLRRRAPAQRDHVEPDRSAGRVAHRRSVESHHGDSQPCDRSTVPRQSRSRESGVSARARPVLRAAEPADGLGDRSPQPHRECAR